MNVSVCGLACQNYNLAAPDVEIVKPTAFVQCEYCLEAPCITSQSRGKPSFLSAYGPPRLQNIGKRYRNYREYHRILKKAGLWNNPIYLLKKYELGVHWRCARGYAKLRRERCQEEMAESTRSAIQGAYSYYKLNKKF